jgi:hypothetical protein
MQATGKGEQMNARVECGRGAGAAIVLALACLVLSAIAPQARAAFGEQFGIAPAEGPALPGPSSLWAGTCNLSNPAAEVGEAPSARRHCIDFGDVAEESASPWDVPPQWRLEPVLQAGSHPDVTLAFAMNRTPTFIPEGDIKDAISELPPGGVVDPNALPKCTAAQFATSPPTCPPESQVGIAEIYLPTAIYMSPVYNLEARHGNPGEFGIPDIATTTVRVIGDVRTAGDFGLTGSVQNIPSGLPLMSQAVTFWGVPWAAEHDRWRVRRGFHREEVCAAADTDVCPPQLQGLPREGLQGIDPKSSLPDENFDPVSYDQGWGPIKPLVSLPTSCSSEDLKTTARVASWQSQPAQNDPGAADFDASDPAWRNFDYEAPPMTDCVDVPFDPSISVDPTSKSTDTPTGYDVEVHVPQNNQPAQHLAHNPNDEVGAPAHWRTKAGRATAHLKDAVVRLPEGTTLNAGAADGLQACSEAQMGLVSRSPLRFDNNPVSCPDGAQIGKLEIETPLLDDLFTGEAYLAAQDANPFGSTFAIYLVAHSKERGIILKTAGRVDVNATTGRITSTFVNQPQLPFDTLRIRFKGGDRATLANPLTCGSHTTTTEMTPWSGNPAAVRHNAFQIDSGPGGSGCVSDPAQRPFAPILTAGTTNPIAGAYSPFVLQVKRADGEQEIKRVDLDLPPGFTARLKGTPYCSDGALASIASAARSAADELAGSLCPVASKVGRVIVGAGPGSRPFYTEGSAYLAGPYKGAPLSMAVVVPAKAGPIDLGNVVVRNALYVDPDDAQVHVVSDEIPHILKGIQVRVRSATVILDKPDFAINPTNCQAMAITGSLGGAADPVNPADDVSVPISNRFQIADCAGLGFKPRIGLRLLGGTRRAAHPSLRAVVRPRPGEANIGRAAVTLPNSAFLDQAHIRTICTRVQFAADSCPKAAIYGQATAWSPLLDQPLRGPVYLRSSNNNLPDMVVDLRGPAHQPIRVELVGRIDSIKGRIRNTFDLVPDAPVSRFVLQMQGGKKGLITNSRNLCAKPSRARANLHGQNGKRHTFRPRVVAVKCKQAKKRRKARRGSHRR